MPGQWCRGAMALAGLWAGLATTAHAVPTAPRPPCDLGPLYYRGAGVGGTARQTAGGPVFESLRAPSGPAFAAVRPLYSRVSNLPRDRALCEVLWPIGVFQSRGDERAWRVLTVFGFQADAGDPSARRFTWVLPVVFTGRDADGRGYFALFPLGGQVRDILTYDSATFALFPLYAHTRQDDAEAHHVLWPLLSWGGGDGTRHVRVFPLYGESEHEGRWRKRFVCWPVWTSARYAYPGSEGGGFILFPLFGHAAVGDETETWMVLPPFFRYSRGPRHTALNAPWPFVRYETGVLERFYLWPLWGRRTIGPVRSWFALWPIVSGERIERRSETAKRFLLLPFVQHETVHAVDPAAGEAAAPHERNLKLWPLFRYERRGEDRRWRILDLWPLKHADSIDRNYAPFWTLARHAEVDGTREDEVLWGLYRRRREEDGARSLSLFPLYASSCADAAGAEEVESEWRVLMGLLGCRREGLRRTWRLLYWLRWHQDIEPE